MSLFFAQAPENPPARPGATANGGYVERVEDQAAPPDLHVDVDRMPSGFNEAFRVSSNRNRWICGMGLIEATHRLRLGTRFMSFAPPIWSDLIPASHE